MQSAQKKNQSRFIKEEERLKAEYEGFVSVQQENKKVNLNCKQKQDKAQVEKETRAQQ